MAAIVFLFIAASLLTLPESSVEGASIENEVLHFQNSKYEGMKDTVDCNPSKCKLPKCFCSGTSIPGGLKPKDTPQMVVLSFQNAVQPTNANLYRQLFSGRKNPNKCPATGTFFVSHQYTDYFEVQTLYSQGHEIGDNTVTWGSNQSSWETADYKTWLQESKDQRTMLNKWGNVTMQDIRGFRAPYLAMGGDKEYKALPDAGLSYDASWTSIQFDTKPNLLWPYTLDYQSIQDCVYGSCPQQPHAGFWEFPLLDLIDRNNHPCVTPEGCDVQTKQQAYNLLYNKFTEHYSSNRAPLLLALGTQWVNVDYKLQGTLQFLDKIKSNKDVYIVSAWRALQWIQNPTTLSNLPKFKPWSCSGSDPPVCAAKKAINCQYDKDRKLIPQDQSSQPVFILRTCMVPCPKCYPWINDPEGKTC